VLCYGCSADAVDDYVRIGKDTIFEAVRRYISAVIAIFRLQLFRALNDEDNGTLE
jgi:hypothetical protein